MAIAQAVVRLLVYCEEFLHLKRQIRKIRLMKETKAIACLFLDLCSDVQKAEWLIQQMVLSPIQCRSRFMYR